MKLKIKKIRPASESKTIQCIDSSERRQNWMLLIGGSLIIGWVVIPDSWQEKISSRAVPILTGAIPVLGAWQKFTNSALKNGRLDVGDIYTGLGELGPDKGDWAVSVLMNAGEQKLFDEFVQAKKTSPKPLKRNEVERILSSVGITNGLPTQVADPGEFRSGQGSRQIEHMTAIAESSSTSEVPDEDAVEQQLSDVIEGGLGDAIAEQKQSNSEKEPFSIKL